MPCHFQYPIKPKPFEINQLASLRRYVAASEPSQLVLHRESTDVVLSCPSKKIPPPYVRCYLCIFSVSNTDQAHVMLVYGSPLQLSYQGPNSWSLSDRWKTKLLCNNWMTLSWLSCCFYRTWRFGDCNAAAALKSTIAAQTPTSSTLRCSRFPGNLGHGKNLSCVM